MRACDSNHSCWEIVGRGAFRLAIPLFQRQIRWEATCWRPVRCSGAKNFREIVGIARYQPSPRWLLTARLVQASTGDNSATENWGTYPNLPYTTRVQDYGNRIPNFTFEISTEPLVAGTAEDLQPYTISPWDLNGDKPIHSAGTTEFRTQLFQDADEINNPAHFTVTTSLAAAEALIPGDYPFFMGYYTSTNELLSLYDTDTGLNDGYGARYVYLMYATHLPGMVLPPVIGPVSGCAAHPAAGDAAQLEFRSGHRQLFQGAASLGA